MKPFANPVLPLVKEVRTEENPDVILDLLHSGNWVAINGVNDRGVLKLVLGRVTGPSADQEAQAHRLRRPLTGQETCRE